MHLIKLPLKTIDSNFSKLLKYAAVSNKANKISFAMHCYAMCDEHEASYVLISDVLPCTAVQCVMSMKPLTY